MALLTQSNEMLNILMCYLSWHSFKNADGENIKVFTQVCLNKKDFYIRYLSKKQTHKKNTTRKIYFDL